MFGSTRLQDLYGIGPGNRLNASPGWGYTATGPAGVPVSPGTKTKVTPMRHLTAAIARTIHTHRLADYALIAGLWVASDLGYFWILPQLSLQPSYNQDPIGAASYYFYWTGVAVILFFRVYATWPIYARWTTFKSRLLSLGLWSLFFFSAIAFTSYVLPRLPPFLWAPELGPEPELPMANSLYFLPKSIEILFQQLLVIALVLIFAAQKFSMRKMSVLCAVMFGSAHVMLLFDPVPLAYVVRFVVLATLFGAIFPRLILRVPNGFAYSYALHWGFYALMVFLGRVIGPTTALANLHGLFGGS